MLALAATLLIGLAIGHSTQGAEPMPMLGMGEVVTGAAEMATAELSDGTVVRLAPRSTLRVIESYERREVWLDGKAFFAVSADEENPFFVRSRAGDTHVVGTRFEVEVVEDDLRVAVLEGRVNVGDERSRVELSEGQIARSVGGAPPTVIDHGNVAGLLDWVGAFVAFESTPLRRVAEEIEVHFAVEVQIADSSLYNRTVTAWFGGGDVESVLAVVCRVADVHCSLHDGVATIEP